MVNLFEYKIVKDTRDKKIGRVGIQLQTKQKEKINGSR